MFDGTAQRLNITFINTILIIYACAPARPRVHLLYGDEKRVKERESENEDFNPEDIM